MDYCLKLTLYAYFWLPLRMKIRMQKSGSNSLYIINEYRIRLSKYQQKGIFLFFFQHICRLMLSKNSNCSNLAFMVIITPIVR